MINSVLHFLNGQVKITGLRARGVDARAVVVAQPPQISEGGGNDIMADGGFRELMMSLGGIFIVTLIVLDLLLYFTVVRPVSRLSALADQISLGNFSAPELPASGKSEISVLAGSFNRMRRSLEKALNLLDGQ